LLSSANEARGEGDEAIGVAENDVEHGCIGISGGDRDLDAGGDRDLDGGGCLACFASCDGDGARLGGALSARVTRPAASAVFSTVLLAALIA
jgi:hypothetical protein